MTLQNNETTQNRLIPVTQWTKYHPYPTIGALRALIFNAETNGFKKVIRRINSRVLISEQDFFKWVDETNGIKGA